MPSSPPPFEPPTQPPAEPPSQTPSPPPPNKRSPEGQTAAELFPSKGDGIAPFWPPHLIDIFIEPRAFFSPKAALGKPFYLAMAVLMAGLSQGISRIDQLLLDTQIVGTKTNWEELGPILKSWPTFWVTNLMGGAIAGILLWIIGGWWFRMRIRLSGDPKPDPKLARIVFIYAFLVRAIPHLALVLFWTVSRSNYGEAFNNQGMALSLLLTSAFGFGELYSAYSGVMTLFSVERDRARLWFIFAPAVFYGFGLSLIISELMAV